MTISLNPTIEIQESWVLAGSCRTFYLAAGSGKPVILLHGAGGNSALFKPIIDGLASWHTVIAPDLPGHGRTQGSVTEYAMNRYSEWLISLIFALGIDRADVCGHSLGGAIALRFAEQHSQVVDHLILINPISLGWPSLRATLYLLIGMFSPRQEIALDLIGQVMFGGSHDERQELTLRYLSSPGAYPRGLGGLIWMLVRSWRMGWPMSGRRLKRLRAPVKLIWGEADWYFPIRHARRALRLIPESRLTLVTGAGHAPFLERPMEVNEAIRSSLAQNEYWAG